MNTNIYKPESNDNINMLPGNPKGLPDESYSHETLVFIDANFLSKVSYHFGEGKYLVYDLIKFSNYLSKKQKLNCKDIFYYTAPPFMSEISKKDEENKIEGYSRFVNKLSKKGVIIREGRCQRLKIDDKYVYHQKAVDILLAMDLMKVPIKYPDIKKIILIASDSDFVPVIMSLEEEGIKTILYTYYEEKRNTNLSRSNYLIKSVHKYVKLNLEDFTSCPIIKDDSTHKNKGPEVGDKT
ncbi:hypothetical protein COU57_01345 [Candidatus Pacearchaeota archaeon CG10_big_fil_rev_8_21_14_0_10_32_14]|nr:MAG: hypothetical protein COU57_01345 [Candidatus Pacearchaeota archaeon CG10_big_fil_rev_8_21_14_0_10_32_14]